MSARIADGSGVDMAKNRSESKPRATKNRGKNKKAGTSLRTKPKRASTGKTPTKKTLATAPAGIARTADLDTQRGKDIQTYDQAMRLLNGRKYTEAKQLLTMLLEAPTIEVAHTARMRLLMIEKFTDPPNK